MKNFKNLGLILALVLFVASCAPVTNIAYLQDRALNAPEQIDEQFGIVIQPKDMLSIVVSSRNPELAAMFNLPTASYQAGSEITSTNAGTYRLLGYVVDIDGTIDFPILGRINISGMTRWEVSTYIKDRLIEEKLLDDPVVTVEFMNFKVSVLGEVNSPGTFTINGDKVTVLQAISLARDLTIFGKRENVAVVREIDGERIIYQMDLTSVDMFKSPGYYLKQNDIVYVEPSEIKARQSTVDDKTLRVTSIMVSTGSLLITIANLIINLAR